MVDDNMPPLPHGDYAVPFADGDVETWDADSMHAYARAYAEQETRRYVQMRAERDRLEQQTAELRRHLQWIVDRYESRSELVTNDADLAGGLYDIARKGLK